MARVFSQSRVKVSASLTNEGSLVVRAFDIVNGSLSVVWGGNKKFAEIRAGPLSRRFRTRGYVARACAPP